MILTCADFYSDLEWKHLHKQFYMQLYVYVYMCVRVCVYSFNQKQPIFILAIIAVKITIVCFMTNMSYTLYIWVIINSLQCRLYLAGTWLNDLPLTVNPFLACSHHTTAETVNILTYNIVICIVDCVRNQGDVSIRVNPVCCSSECYTRVCYGSHNHHCTLVTYILIPGQVLLLLWRTIWSPCESGGSRKLKHSHW